MATIRQEDLNDTYCPFRGGPCMINCMMLTLERESNNVGTHTWFDEDKGYRQRGYVYEDYTIPKCALSGDRNPIHAKLTYEGRRCDDKPFYGKTDEEIKADGE